MFRLNIRRNGFNVKEYLGSIKMSNLEYRIQLDPFIVDLCKLKQASYITQLRTM